ncbi:DnaD domain protein [Bacillus kandeliae]|uniref:DnaD domain protein n=1 Tax=Bacillus kandeliae TaxID=3129297 RepID=UPI0039B76415
MSNEDQYLELITYLKETSPRQILIDISGSLPSKADLKVVEGVMFQYKLPAGVVNVLIQYVFLKTDMKMTKSYVEKIASHWARKKVKTVEQAMELAKKEHQQYLQWARNQKVSPTPVERTKLEAIEAASLSDMSDEQLGVFVRKLFRQ